VELVLALKADLEDGVGPGGVVVGAVLGSDSGCHAEGDVLHEVVAVGYFGFGQTHDVDVVLGVFPALSKQYLANSSALSLSKSNSLPQ